MDILYNGYNIHHIIQVQIPEQSMDPHSAAPETRHPQMTRTDVRSYCLQRKTSYQLRVLAWCKTFCMVGGVQLDRIPVSYQPHQPRRYSTEVHQLDRPQCFVELQKRAKSYGTPIQTKVKQTPCWVGVYCLHFLYHCLLDPKIHYQMIRYALFWKLYIYNGTWKLSHVHAHFIYTHTHPPLPTDTTPYHYASPNMA